MKQSKYLTGSDAPAFVKEEIFHTFKDSVVLEEEKSAPEHHGWFRLVFRYIPKSYMIWFEGEFNGFNIRITRDDGAYTALEKLIDYKQDLTEKDVRDSIEQLQHILQTEIALKKV
mgnify:CR=1 FL=1